MFPYLIKLVFTLGMNSDNRQKDDTGRQYKQ